MTVERHARTGAAKTTTPEQATSRTPPTVAQILAEQNKVPSNPLAAPPKEEILPPVRVMSEEALERNLTEWSGSLLLGAMFSFNGQTGVYHMRDGTEMPIDSEFIGLLELMRKGGSNLTARAIRPQSSISALAKIRSCRHARS
jgi:hypothetical protein